MQINRAVQRFALVVAMLCLLVSVAWARWGYKEGPTRDGCYRVCVGSDLTGWICVKGDCHEDLAVPEK